jgi:hypothetical protein
MQLQLPFFPEGTKYINSSVGFRKQANYVYYLHNGSPIYCHSEDDHNGYRFCLGNLVVLLNCSRLTIIAQKTKLEPWSKQLSIKRLTCFLIIKTNPHNHC